jgi:hypothetical protein
MSLYIKIFKVAKKDKEFISEFASIEGNTLPGIFSDDLDKAMWGAAYYGWLIGKKGAVLGQQIYEQIKGG